MEIKGAVYYVQLVKSKWDVRSNVSFPLSKYGMAKRSSSCYYFLKSGPYLLLIEIDTALFALMDLHQFMPREYC